LERVQSAEKPLAVAKDLLADHLDPAIVQNATINVPTMAVIATDFFDEFLRQNKLQELDFENLSDTQIGITFQHADLPVELLGDLRALISQVSTPLAVRSSSLLEDALERPFAGVYATKMIPNNQFDVDNRFRRLVEAIKFVYASAFFKEAREYIRTTGRKPADEKMAVILQEIVGRRHGDRFYPDISGVARSVNFYPTGQNRPEDGVVTLALGLGKTIVDGGVAWTFSPAQPKSPPPFGSIDELLEGTQSEFWAVNMGKPPAYDPVNEVEYMVLADLAKAEADEVLQPLASTFDPERQRVVPGTWVRGPRILNFAPMLVLEQFPLNYLIRTLLRAAEKSVDAKVEIEFAITLEARRDAQLQVRLGFLQVRPMVVSDQLVNVTQEDLQDARAIVASDRVMGNGIIEDIQDIVFVRPENFSAEHTPLIAEQLGEINSELRDQAKPYLLIGFGRWGSSHSSLGIPVTWSQISGARAIVEATLPGMNVELSQGSHFFHNLSSFRANYFMVHFDGRFPINWTWLNEQLVIRETEYVRHVRTASPLCVRVDGRSARGLILPGVKG
jgi:Pyruvate phosphate dikinase, AMP/ATP-binding domain